MAKIAAPLALKLSSHWVLRRGKQPFNSYGNPKGWTQPEFWITFDEAVKVLESNPKKFDGIGYIVARDPLREGDQILGGDLDCCRDPVTGQGSRWALSILEKLNTCAAVSISKCGYRFFCYGKLPEGLNDVMGHGHDDLTEDMKAHILEAKPKAGEKLAKGQPVWNGFELYEDGPKHLTITGEWLPEYQAELQHRQTEIAEIIGPFLKVAKAKEAPKQRIKRKGSLPPLSVLDVIDTSGFSRVADELVGPNPVIGSIHGTNLKVNDGQNIWCNFHNNIKKGGDAWLWLACECGAIQWEEAGPGALSDPTVLKKVKQYAIEKGYFTAEELDVVAGMEIADALSLVDDLKDQEKVKADPGLPFEPQYVRALAVVKRHNKAEYERTRAALKKARVHVGELDKAINQIQGVGGSARKIVNSDIGIITFDDVCKANNDGYEFSTTQAANAVTSKLKLVMEEGNDRQIWYFDGKFYVNNGKSLISHLLYTAGDDYAQKRLVAEVLDRVTSELQLSPIKFNPKPFQFGCLDGLLDLSTGKFRGYRPEDYITISHQVSYELEGDIRPFLWFLSTIFPDPRDVLTAIDIFTATGMRIPFDSFIQLIGGGSDGKGIFEKIMIILFSPPRTTAMTIRELKDNPRFGPGQLLDKDLWIVSEVSSAKDATDILKKIATGEFIDSDEKYATERKRGRPHATTILDCNNAFDFADDSWGRKRRQIKLDCPFRFGDLKGDRPIDRHLEEKLTQPQILSAIIKLMGARGPYLAKERKIYTRKRPEEMAEEYRRQQYSLNYFCEECLEASPGAVLLVKDCYNEYLEYCRYFAVPTPAERSPFGKYIKACFGIESKSEDGKRVYRGLAINAKAFTVWAQEKSNYEISNKSDDEIGIDWKKTAKNMRNTELYTT
jgi:phage/plasmid-associated DNA primase